jgi:hypothetical protein
VTITRRRRLAQKQFVFFCFSFLGAVGKIDPIDVTGDTCTEVCSKYHWPCVPFTYLPLLFWEL